MLITGISLCTCKLRSFYGSDNDDSGVGLGLVFETSRRGVNDCTNHGNFTCNYETDQSRQIKSEIDYNGAIELCYCVYKQ